MNVEQLAAAALLREGISLPLFRIFGKQVRMTIKAPCLGSLMRISNVYSGMGVTMKQLQELDFEGKVAFVGRYGKEISRMLAYCMISGKYTGWLLNGPMAWIVRHYMHPVLLEQAWIKMLSMYDTCPFCEYYHLSSETERTKDKQRKKGGPTKKEQESKKVMKPSNSLFGMIGTIATETGWTVDYIMWKVSYVTLILMSKDAPRLVDESELHPKDPSHELINMVLNGAD